MTIDDSEETEIILTTSSNLFGERKSVAYRIPQINQLIVANAISVSSCAEENIHTKQRQLLFAEHIWPGALVIADYLVENPQFCKEKSVLELGAGVGLPSIVASKLDAGLVVCSDFPDSDLLDHVKTVALTNRCSNFFVEPHRWGDVVDNLVGHVECNGGFDVIILAECLWKDTYRQHDNLWNSVTKCCHPVGSTSTTIVLISFAHRPCDGHTPDHDLEFIKKGKNMFGFDCKLIKSVDKYHDAMECDVVTEYLYLAIRK